ncbi:MAG TPA: hypothetical protein VLM40_07760 [Gemmata sp.]|nr:hypothetical protein [Gemmata sp.]
MVRTVRRAATASVAFSILLLSSCGSSRETELSETGASLEGTVSFGGTPVEVALIIVAGPNGSCTGNIDEATGRYRVDNVPLGEVKIGVNTEAGKGQLIGKQMSGYYKGPEAKSRGILKPPKVIDIPNKYADPNGSGITTTIKSGANTYDIVIPK